MEWGRGESLCFVQQILHLLSHLTMPFQTIFIKATKISVELTMETGHNSTYNIHSPFIPSISVAFITCSIIQLDFRKLDPTTINYPTKTLTRKKGNMVLVSFFLSLFKVIYLCVHIGGQRTTQWWSSPFILFEAGLLYFLPLYCILRQACPRTPWDSVSTSHITL